LDEVLVDMAFGTGVVKVTPAHDPNDFSCARRHGLPFLSIFTNSGTIYDGAPENLRNLDRFEARKVVVNMLTEKDLFVEKKVILLKPDQKCKTAGGIFSGAVREFLIFFWSHAMNLAWPYGNLNLVPLEEFLIFFQSHAMSIARCSRTNDVIEPMLMWQWFLDCRELAANAAALVRKGEIAMHPNSAKQDWYNWLERDQR
jgi:valyl-tRNA synthetase